MQGNGWRTSWAVAALVALGMLGALGCGGSAPRVAAPAIRSACALDEQFLAGRCQAVAGRPHLEAGRAALAKFEVEAASAELDAAVKAGPLDYDSHVALWEQRGIAAAYLEDEAAALRAFDMLLTLDPGHLLSYTLSPRATFVFEKARLAARTTAKPALQLSWKRDARTADPLPVDVEVIADPKRALRRATLLMRTHGAGSWRAVDFDLRGAGGYQRVVLPAVGGTRPATLELYLRAFDDDHNEVLRWASPEAPREVALRYEPPEPWHRKWWVRVAGGTVLLAATAVVVYAVTREPPGSVGGDVVVK
jgi:tetratricopeptide (TPR) repeat protein